MSARTWNRKATHAGSWYEENSEKLDKELSNWLEDSSSVKAKGKLRAIIAPHAGYTYSGSTAAYAYKSVDCKKVQRVFLLGPSHHYYLNECALTAALEYQTPFGPIKIDHDINEQLKQNNTGKFTVMKMSQDEDEHSLEMHLPYIFKMMNPNNTSDPTEEKHKFTLVPVLVGNLSNSKELEYGRILAPYLRDESNIFIISSDFCHWGSRFDFTTAEDSSLPIYKNIEIMDKQGMKLIEEKTLQGFQQYLSKTQNTICGRHPISVLLGAIQVLETDAEQQISFKISFVKYAQSSQVVDKRDSSVSYASALCFTDYVGASYWYIVQILFVLRNHLKFSPSFVAPFL